MGSVFTLLQFVIISESIPLIKICLLEDNMPSDPTSNLHISSVSGVVMASRSHDVMDLYHLGLLSIPYDVCILMKTTTHFSKHMPVTKQCTVVTECLRKLSSACLCVLQFLFIIQLFFYPSEIHFFAGQRLALVTQI